MLSLTFHIHLGRCGSTALGHGSHTHTRTAHPSHSTCVRCHRTTCRQCHQGEPCTNSTGQFPFLFGPGGYLRRGATAVSSGHLTWGVVRMYAQGVPEAVERVALNKCLRDATAIDGVLNCHAPRFWALHPGALVGTLRVRVAAADEQKVLREVHAVFDSALGCSNLTVQVEKDSA